MKGTNLTVSNIFESAKQMNERGLELIELVKEVLKNK